MNIHGPFGVRLARAACLGSVALTLCGGSARAEDGTLVPTGESFYHVLDDVLLGDPGGAQVRLNGSLVLEASALRARLCHPALPLCSGPPDLDVGVKLLGAMALELEADAGGRLAASIPAVMVRLGTFDFGPSSPLSVDVLLAGLLCVEGELEAGMVASVVQQFEFKAAYGRGGLGRFFLDPAATRVAQLAPPGLSGSTALDLEVTFVGAVLFELHAGTLATFGPAIAGEAAARLAVDPAGDPWWSTSARFRAAAGSYGQASGLRPSMPLYQTSWHLADAGGPFAGPRRRAGRGRTRSRTTRR